MPLRAALALAFLGLLPAAGADAASFGRFQHGGRATGQAGAFVARADDPAAVAYNPAALARSSGVGLLAGLDFEAPTDRWSSATGAAKAEHQIQFPPALYLTWRRPEARLALGLGLDSPLWQLVDWQTFDFPGRFVARRGDQRLLELHPVAAWRLSEGWSVGGGLRWVRGSLGFGDARVATAPTAAGPLDYEVDRLAEATADGLGWDLGAHFEAPRWGLGAVWKSAVAIEGSGDLTYLIRDPAALPADVLATQSARLAPGSSRLAEELPARLSAGVWWAAGERLKLELDAELARWGSVEVPVVTDEPEKLGPGFEIARRAGREDTLSVRLGAELALSSAWSLGAGVAFEPSPVTASAVDPGAPRGDARVLCVGAGWSAGWLRFDAGWSYHDLADQPAHAQEPDPEVRGTYSGHSQVWSVSARWRW
jgi:long-chain fatty acid transport protein